MGGVGLRLVGATDDLLCRDRSIGHDWADDTHWEDGDVVRRGRRTIFVTFRVSRCWRCGTVRKEVFEQHEKVIVKQTNRYTYTKEWKQAARLTQPEIHTRLRRQAKGA